MLYVANIVHGASWGLRMYRIMPSAAFGHSQRNLHCLRSGTERTFQGNDLELIPTKMETRHPVEIYFGREFPAICYHCGVPAA